MKLKSMKSESIILTGCLLGILVVFWLVSNLIAPLSVEHGEHITLAKLMAQGEIPYRNFVMTETPIVISILSVLYQIVGIEASSYWASGLLILTHLLNGYLLLKLMQRLSVKKEFACFGLIYYLLVVYSSDGLMLNLEPFAVSFLLGASLSILQRSTMGLIGASICYALALGCKAQAICVFPVLVMMVLWKGNKSRFQLERGLLFITLSGVIVAAEYFGIMQISQNTEWAKGLFQMQEIKPFQTWENVLDHKFDYIVIQGGRCGLFFLLALPWVWKKLSLHGKRCIYWALVALIGYLGLFYWDIKVSHGMLVYPLVVMALTHILQELSNKWCIIALSIAVLAAPTLLTIREFQKLEMGEVKMEQQEELIALKQIIQKPGLAIVHNGECWEYELGPQIIAEIPQLRPLDSFDQMDKADYIILTEEGFTELSYSEHSDSFFECISEMKSYGTGSYMVYVRESISHEGQATMEYFDGTN